MLLTSFELCHLFEPLDRPIFLLANFLYYFLFFSLFLWLFLDCLDTPAKQFKYIANKRSVCNLMWVDGRGPRNGIVMEDGIGIGWGEHASWAMAAKKTKKHNWHLQSARYGSEGTSWRLPGAGRRQSSLTPPPAIQHTSKIFAMTSSSSQGMCDF